MTADAPVASRRFRRHPATTGPRPPMVCLPHAGEMALRSEVATGGFPLQVFPGGHFHLAAQREALIHGLAERTGVASS